LDFNEIYILCTELIYFMMTGFGKFGNEESFHVKLCFSFTGAQ